MSAVGWTLVAIGTAGLVGLLAFAHRRDVREHLGVDAIRAQLTEVVEVDPVTTAPTDWDAHVESAVAMANSGRRTYDIRCRACGRRVTGTRVEVLTHLVAVHGPETPDMAAELNRLDQEVNA